jgi:predicted acylesterase/phospholipase RssA
MARISSALPVRTRILFVILFFIAWRIEDSLLYRLGILYAAHSPSAAIHLEALNQTASGGLSFVSDGFSYMGTTILNAYSGLPDYVRDVIPTAALGRWISAIAGFFGIGPITSFVYTLLGLAGQLARVVIAFNVAGWMYNLLRRVARYLTMAFLVPVGFYSEKEPAQNEAAPDSVNEPGSLERQPARRREYFEFLSGHVERIGIILPGGGARGTYQAGALQAVHDFLRDYGALGKVKMITASSIGAWNAMFWLAGMMDRESGGFSLENWWKQIEVSRLVEFPWFWMPFFSESRFRIGPWREQFMELFHRKLDPLFVGAPAIHFYFTRSDVALGALGYATNWSGIRQVTEKLGLDKQDNYRFVDVIEADGEQIKRTADAVFASLGNAPFFQGRWGDILFEDGGALDPVPLRFASPLENCDLVFILPAKGPIELAGRSRVHRMERVIHLQQSALEHASLRNADTINRVSERFERMQFGAQTIASSGASGVAADAIDGVQEEIDEFNHAYKRLYLFTAYPAANLPVSNFGFRQRKQIAEGFDLMYEQTRTELQHRLFEDVEAEDAQVVMIDGAIGSDGKPVKPTYRRAANL